MGSGGREQALAEALLRSPQVAHVYMAPGNAAATAKVSEGFQTSDGTCFSSSPLMTLLIRNLFAALKLDRISSVAIEVKDVEGIGTFAKQEDVSLVVVGPEEPLVKGMADALSKMGMACFGCSALAAR